MFKSFIWPGFLLLVLAQWLVPSQMIWKKNKILTRGVSYKFEAEPIDPSNPFMGKYVILYYKDNVAKFSNGTTFSYDSLVYVSFISGKDGFAKIKSIDKKKPQHTDYLETMINSISEEKDSISIVVNYPFTKYYMEEYKAPRAEKIYWESRIDTTLKVYALVNIFNGDAVIKEVYVHDSLINDVIKTRNLIRQKKSLYH